MTKTNENCPIQDQLIFLSKIEKALKNCPNQKNKLKILKNFNQSEMDGISNLALDLQIVMESLFVIGQGKKIFENIHSVDQNVISFLKSLLPVEIFYSEIGGIVGYHIQFLELLLKRKQPCKTPLRDYESPPAFDLTKNPEATSIVMHGIMAVPQIAEIYPLAGAADRLDLRDSKTDEPLPAAALQFLGFSLLEVLIRDTIGREFLHYKLTGKQTTTPFVLMTSEEKNNYHHIQKILVTKNWFQRPSKSYYFIYQPLVPMISSNGEWVIKGPLSLMLKPGGHGAIWKLLYDQGALKWLKDINCTKALIRQINNPIAGVDNGLLAITGLGCKENRVFGFSSCDRLVNTEEGMDVLIKEKIPEGYRYTITNIEYTVFHQLGVEDKPKEAGSLYSQFPANSNILFSDLKKLEPIIAKNPYPGMMINLKSQVPVKDSKGAIEIINAARIETTMQNIADYLAVNSREPLNEIEKQNHPTFVIHNIRRKTLAAAKRSKKNGSLNDTPEGAFFDLLKNSHELLKFCEFEVPDLNEDEYNKNEPSFIFTYHPALGPLYSVIQQKLRKGKLHKFSELKLEIADVWIHNVNVAGSLLIFSEQTVGHINKKGHREYSNQTGKCFLENVKIENLGIDYSLSPIFWKNQMIHKESVKIIIEGNGEFYAKDVTFKGNYSITVPADHKMTAYQSGQSIKFELESIKHPSWQWNYNFNNKNEIVLSFDIYKGNK